MKNFVLNCIGGLIKHKLAKLLVFFVFGMFMGVVILITQGILVLLHYDQNQIKSISDSMVNYLSVGFVCLLVGLGFILALRQLAAELRGKFGPQPPVIQDPPVAPPIRPGFRNDLSPPPLPDLK